jgi:hypothetical protein
MSRTFHMAAVALMTLSSLALNAGSDDKAGQKPHPVVGAWKQVESKNGDAQEYQKSTDGTVINDLIVGGRFSLAFVKDGKVLGLIGGRYKAEGDKFSEIIECVSGEGIPDSFVGSTFDFTVKVDGDTMTKVGTIKVGGQDYKIDEKWERCK